jgi:hypothetical protein
MKKQWIEPKAFQIGDVNGKTVVVPPCDDKERFIVNTVKNKNQIHHTLHCPKEINDQGKFTLDFAPAMTSALYLQMGDNGDHSYIFYVDVYGNWHKYYQEVSSTVNSMLSRTNQETTPDEYKAMLMDALQKRNYSVEVINRAYNDNAPRAGQTTAELFRQVATAVLIQEKLDRDVEGAAMMKFCRATKQLYCAHLDAHPEMKETIYGAVRINEKMIDEPAAELVDELFKWTLYDEKRPTLANKIDYSKSPAVGVKVFLSTPKTGQKTDGKVMLPTGQVIWTAIYDLINRKLSDAATPISTFEEFSEFTYMKGDNNKGKMGFRLLQAIKTLEIGVFWGEVTKRGSFQFKAIELTVYKKISFGGGVRSLAPTVMQSKLAAGQRALELYGLQDQQASGGGWGGGDEQDQPDQQGQKRLAGATDENERDTKRANLFDPL